MPSSTARKTISASGRTPAAILGIRVISALMGARCFWFIMPHCFPICARHSGAGASGAWSMRKSFPFLSWCKAFSTRIQPNTVLTRQRSSPPIFPALFRPNMKGITKSKAWRQILRVKFSIMKKWANSGFRAFPTNTSIFRAYSHPGTILQGGAKKPGCFLAAPPQNMKNGWPPPAPTPNMSFPHPATLSSSMPGMNGARAPAWSQTKIMAMPG